MFWSLIALLIGCPGSSEPAARTCPDGEVMDGDACVPEACGTGTWGDLDAISPTIFVDASAQPGGDGSMEVPFNTISDALDAEADAGVGVIAVAVGTYREALRLTKLHKGVILAGRCAELVIIDAEGEDFGVEIRSASQGMSAMLSGFTVQGASVAGMQVEYADVALASLLLQDNDGRGLNVEGAGTVATLVDVTVARTVADEDGDAYGVAAWAGTVLVATDLVLEDNLGYGLLGSGYELSQEDRPDGAGC